MPPEYFGAIYDSPEEAEARYSVHVAHVSMSDSRMAAIAEDEY